MHLLKPSNERLMVGPNGTFRRMCIRLYQSILRCLLKSYRQYAISDMITIDGGRIKIVHELRDLEFENELARNNIDVRPHMLYNDIPVAISKGRFRFCFKYFKWKDQKSIYFGENELFIKHDDSLLINGNVINNILCSSAKDIIVRSIIELQTIMKEQHPHIIHEEVESLIKNKNAKAFKNGLFVGERVRGREQLQNIADALSQPEEEQRIIKHGFEIDTTF